MYAVWEEQIIYMQDATSCATVPEGETKILVDSRDGQKYPVYHIPSDAVYPGTSTKANVADKCFMTKDLNLGAVDSVAGSSSTIVANGTMTLSSEDSNFTNTTSAGESLNIPTTSVTVLNNASGVSQTNSYTNKQYTASGTGDYAGRGYYSWGAAMTVCPKGWSLPASYEYNSSEDYNTSGIGISKLVNNNVNTAMSDPWLFVLGGEGGYTGATSNGNYWSSTQYTSAVAYTLLLNTGGGLKLHKHAKKDELAVRCIAESIDGYMQDFDIYTELPNTGDSIKLADKRDNKVYAVKRLPDGKVWMMQNLTVNGVELTPEDTNIADGNIYYLPKDGGAGNLTNPSTKNATTGYNFANGSDNQAMFKFRYKGTDATNDSDTGYYNFYTATLGYSYYSDGKTSGTSSQDICPKGWRMPRTTDAGTTVSTTGTANDFTNLVHQYSTSGWSGTATDYSYSTTNSTAMNSMYKSAASPLATATANNYAGFSYAGYWNGTDTSASYVGSNGYYWSASIYNTGNGHYLSFYSSRVYPQYYSSKYYGLAVRCIAKDTRTLSDLTYMQDINGDIVSNTPANAIATLIDKRDNHAYKVKKLPDGKIWMINNLTISATGMVVNALDNTNTNIPASDSSSYYLPPQNTRYASSGNLNNSAVKSASDSPTFSSDYSNYLQVGYRAKNDTNNSRNAAQPEDTAFYNFYTTTLGYSYYNDGNSTGSSPRDVCPKGWKLPKVSDSNQYVAYEFSEFANLARSYNSSASWSGSGSGRSEDYHTSDSLIRTGIIDGDAFNTNNGYAGFTYTGWYTNASLNNVNLYGYYWSSSIYDPLYGYYLELRPSDIYPQAAYQKFLGCAVRCVAQ